jgi:hypothetical protein
LTWQAYEADLEQKLTDLHSRVHRGAYGALPSRRTHIPKADGKQRPLASGGDMAFIMHLTQNGFGNERACEWRVQSIPAVRDLSRR